MKNDPMENPPKNATENELDIENYVDPHLKDLRERTTAEIEAALDESKLSKLESDKDTEAIKNYVDPYLKTLREKQTVKLVEQQSQQIKDVFERNAGLDSIISPKDAFPTKENTIWSKREASKTTPVEEKQVTEPKKESFFQKLRNTITGQGKKAAIVTAMTSASLSGLAQNVQGNKEGDPKKKSTTEIDISKARKVEKIPENYTLIKKGDRTYGYIVQDANTSHEKGIYAKETPQYIQNIKDRLQNGETIENLIKNGEIHPDRASEFEQFYSPKQDVVYLESTPEKKEDLFSIFAKNEQPLYGANLHSFGLMAWPTRSTESIEVAGNLGEYERDIVAIVFQKEGIPTGKRMIVDLKGKLDAKYGPQFAGKRLQDVFSGTHLSSPEARAILDDLADEYTALEKNESNKELSAKQLVEENQPKKQNSIVKN